MDKAWWDVYLSDVNEVFAGEKVNPWRTRPSGVKHVPVDHMKNSGAGAIALAILLGAKKVILLGYDAQKTGGKAHWHGDHPSQLGNAGSVNQWPEFFNLLAQKYRNSSIINASRETAITCFKREELETVLSYEEPKTQFYVESMHGLGDNIFARAFVKALNGDVYVSTPWPQIYSDIPNVKFVNCGSKLRTQAKNIKKVQAQTHPIPHNSRVIKVQYNVRDFQQGSLIDGIKRCFGTEPSNFDLPKFDNPIRSSKPIAVIRPVTVRAEWSNPARNPKSEYIAWVAEQLKDTHHIVSIADLEDKKEWVDGALPFSHEQYNHGELGLSDLLGLISHSDIVVGGVGWIVPACISYNVRLFCILGGHGGHNAPAKITSKDMDLSKTFFATPDKFCHCTNMQHNCTKTISNLEQQWANFLTVTA